MSDFRGGRKCLECGRSIGSSYDHADTCPNHPRNQRLVPDGGAEIVENERPIWTKSSGEEITRSLEELVDELGYVPSGREYIERSRERDDLPSYWSIWSIYNGYSDALRAAGIEPLERFGDLEEALELADELDLDRERVLEELGGRVEP